MKKHPDIKYIVHEPKDKEAFAALYVKTVFDALVDIAKSQKQNDQHKNETTHDSQ